MNIVYMIGNGFDLNLGLKTGYEHFYNYYLDKPNDNSLIEYFKTEINKNINKWSDLEISLGEYVNNFDNVDELYAVYENLVSNLTSYLRDIDHEFEKKSITAENHRNFIKELLTPEDSLRKAEKDNLTSFISKFNSNQFNYRIINFNYTKTFNKIVWNGEPTNKLVWKENGKINNIYPPLHLHGTLKRGLILGVDNVDQINNTLLRNNDGAQEQLLKPLCNTNEGHGEDIQSKSMILNANLVCIFGLSFGQTDQTWWNILTERLKHPNCMAIIFIKNEDSDIYIVGRRKQAAREILSKFITPEQIDNIIDSVYFVSNSNIFKIK